MALLDEDSIEIPPFHPDSNVTKAQVLHFGPHLPTSPWRSPERPVGFFGANKMAPDFKFVKRDRAVFSRLQRCKYLQVVYKNVRAQYKRYIKNSRSIAELLYWKMKLDSLPKGSSPSRYKNACMITGRTRAYYRMVGLGRHKFRDFCNRGFVPGVTRASW
ncbi:Ribosomal protein S14 [Babesia duncani]|uniref:Ribosomal protein S14 n=1 Tax=Babesia duncani TaxID=323732 RepID=A0AAD9UQE4_9APIC|nr:Ribosomal protein S14 [Babesia duncani]